MTEQCTTSCAFTVLEHRHTQSDVIERTVLIMHGSHNEK